MILGQLLVDRPTGCGERLGLRVVRKPVLGVVRRPRLPVDDFGVVFEVAPIRVVSVDDTNLSGQNLDEQNNRVVGVADVPDSDDRQALVPFYGLDAALFAGSS